MKKIINSRNFLLVFTLLFFSCSIVLAEDIDSDSPQNVDIEELARSVEPEVEQESVPVEAVSSATEEDKEAAQELATKLRAEIVLKSEENEVLADQHYQSGLRYFKKGYYRRAIEEFNMVEELISDYKKTKKYLNKAQKRYAMFLTSKQNQKMIKERLEENRDVFLQGELFFKAGYYDKAYQKFEEVLEANPENMLARRYQERIIEKKQKMAEKTREHAFNQKILEVEDAWRTETTLIDKEGKDEDKEDKKIELKSKQQILLEKKANQIIPEINFTNANLRDVVNYLSKISGVNIILDESIFMGESSSSSKETVSDLLGEDLDEEESEEVAVDEGLDEVKTSALFDKVTISLNNIPLLEALKYILAARGLKYRIDEFVIFISTPEKLEQVEMETRYYKLATGITGYTEFETTKVEDEEETSVKETTTIVDVLKESGVPFPPGSKIFLDQRTGTLIVKNTPANLVIIEDILKTLDVTPFQVQIQAKFVEITQSNLEELGLEWMVAKRSARNRNTLGSVRSSQQIIYDASTLSKGLRFIEDDNETSIGDIFSISGILTNPEYNVILHALQQETDADVLSAPKITTVNNQQATIKIVEEIRYPDEYEVTQPTFNEDGSIITPAVIVPGDFQTRESGIILIVTPSVGADRKTITLTLLPEVSSLADWIDYGMRFGDMTMSLYQPVFASSNASTTIIVNDGETVVMGGLISDEIEARKDKVPLLGDLPFVGRAFRTRSDNVTKKNLLIFVTANLLTPSGSKLQEESQQLL